MSYWDGNRWTRDVPADAATTPPPRSRRFLGAAAEAVLITALIFGLIAGTAFAAKGGNGGGHGGGPKPKPGTDNGTIAMVMVDASDTVANWGDWVTFDVATTATSEPWVNLKCWQNGTLVAEGWNGYFDRSLTGRNFGLYSATWSAGAADCTAYLTTPKHAVLASTSFHVEP
jgi:hypothetical protein